MKKIKVLHLTASPFLTGGIEIFLNNISSNLSHVQFDFLTTLTVNDNQLVRGLKQHGSKFIELNINTRNPVIRACKIIQKTVHVLKTKDYHIVNIHSGSIPIVFYFLLASNIAKIPTKISHSHNSYRDKTGIKQIILNLMKIYITNNSDYLFACSSSASECMFTQKAPKDKYYIIKNGINLERFKYNEEIRYHYRKKYNFEEKIILGNIGRLSIQKNQIFLIQIMIRLIKKFSNVMLIIIGIGEEKQKLENLIKKYNLEEYVQLWGARDDIPSILSMFDIFLLPSFWEGLGIVNIEAQVSGVVSIVSNNIPPEAIFTNLVKVLPIDSQETLWENEILKIIHNGLKNRRSYNIEAKKFGYDASDVALTLQNFYLDLLA